MAATAPGEGLLTAPAPAVGAVETENPERGETPREASLLLTEHSILKRATQNSEKISKFTFIVLMIRY